MESKATVLIRKGAVEDMPAVLDLIKELAIYENAEQEVTLTLEELVADGFGPNSIFGLFIAERQHAIVGMALYYEKYSTWKGRCLYLEDIIVTENQRGKGVGKQLFEAVMEVARAKNAARMEWQVLDWNRPAIHFYEKYSATLDPEWLNGKLTREQIQEFT